MREEDGEREERRERRGKEERDQLKEERSLVFGFLNGWRWSTPPSS
jgi:hypothetical protein